MDQATMITLAKIGGYAVFGLSATGSALGAGVAAMAAVGAWKKCYATSKAAPFLIAAFIGAPLSQTIYGMIVMNKILGALNATDQAVAAAAAGNYAGLIGAGVFGGLAIGMSAWTQGMAGAAASDALGETGQGFGNYILALGIIETVTLFTMVFVMIYV